VPLVKCYHPVGAERAQVTFRDTLIHSSNSISYLILICYDANTI